MKNTKTMAALGCAAALVAAQAGVVHAQAGSKMSPAGLWKTIDDETKEPKSLVRITETNGVFSGKIEKILSPGKENSVCEKCEGELKDKPVLGMQIFSGLKREGDDNEYEGARILDPNNGKTYRMKLKPIDGGAKLEMRGYIGPFSRKQIWIREQ